MREYIKSREFKNQVSFLVSTALILSLYWTGVIKQLVQFIVETII